MFHFDILIMVLELYQLVNLFSLKRLDNPVVNLRITFEIVYNQI